MELIAETAWHHEGDFSFMRDLIARLCDASADIIKMHITLDLDEYMAPDHAAYTTLKNWMLSEPQWEELITLVKGRGKRLMLLLNDTKAIRFAAQFAPDFVELHSVCLNVPRLQETVTMQIADHTPVVIGVGGCSLEEVDAAVQAFSGRELVLMFGFQNYPTRYKDVNLAKIRRIQALYPDKTFGYADHTGWDEEHNALITLLVAANGMRYVEKHVTTAYGEERCDYSAAISIAMFNELAEKIKVLDAIEGSGGLDLNDGERAYSQYGPMKMAAVTTRALRKGETVSSEAFEFLRTGQPTDLSQLDVCRLIGKDVVRDVPKGAVLTADCIDG